MEQKTVTFGEEPDLSQMDWGLEEKPMDQVTLQEMEDLCASLFERRKQAEAAEEKAKEEWEAVRKVEARVMAYLQHFQKDKYPVQGLGTISIVRKPMVRVPKTQEEKKAFFKFLDDKGIFWDLATVNSNTLNSFYKAEREAAEQEGRTDFSLPGIGEPSVYETIRITKGK